MNFKKSLIKLTFEVALIYGLGLTVKQINAEAKIGYALTGFIASQLGANDEDTEWIAQVGGGAAAVGYEAATVGATVGAFGGPIGAGVGFVAGFL